MAKPRSQTRKQALARCKEIIRNIRKEKVLEKECWRLISSGALPLQDFENNFLLPRAVLEVALENTANSYAPFPDDVKKIAKNLRHF